MASDIATMRLEPTYFPVLRSVLKNQIQFLVEQLADAGEETLILSANVGNGMVEQLGSESGKLFVDVYDDFKSEFLGFCQRRKGKRKLDSPQKAAGDGKRGKVTPAVMSASKQEAQSVGSPQNVPKVSAARVIVSQRAIAGKSGSTVTQVSTAGNQVIHMPSETPGFVELEDTGEEYAEVDDTGLEYEEMGAFEEGWGEGETDESTETPSSSQDQSTSSPVQVSDGKIKISALARGKVTTQNPNLIITSAGNMKTIKFEKSLLLKNTCKYCNKVFGSERDMKLHIRSHTGEKPFSCGVCGQTFSLKRSLEKHMLKQHVEAHLMAVESPAVSLLKPRYEKS